MSVRGVFVTGTDTGVGKTVVAAAVVHMLRAQGLRVAVMKPVASGAYQTQGGLRNDDAQRLISVSNVTAEYAQVNPYCFAPPVAPHIAAEEAGVVIDPAIIRTRFGDLSRQADAIVVEGVGGWRVPLAAGFDVAALASDLQLPVVLVVGLRLGCLSHARLSAEAIAAADCPLAGWIGSTVDADMERYGQNLATLRRLLPAPCLGIVPHLENPGPESAAAHLETQSLLSLVEDH